MRLLLPALILLLAAPAFAQNGTPTAFPTFPPTPTASATPTATVTPTPPPPPVVINVIIFQPQNATIPHGTTVQITGTAIYSDGSLKEITNVTWTSSAPNIATISPTGLVTGVAAGQTTITATVNGHSGTTRVTVQ